MDFYFTEKNDNFIDLVKDNNNLDPTEFGKKNFFLCKYQGTFFKSISIIESKS